MSRLLQRAIFAAGLVAVGWVGAGYIDSNPLALAMTLLIGVFYLVGVWELHRFSQATHALQTALAGLSSPPPSLGEWLGRLPPSLVNAVRLRTEGERVGLPGPALAPYLGGLLVLLGMVGTFLGMVVTLRGTGIALESATDLLAMRTALSAPVKGLGLAFGTSVAGVAASAMLGLASALCRRERIEAGQVLDAKIATTLRAYSQAHQREESFRLMQRQAEALPRLADRLQSLMEAIEQRSQGLGERLAAGQEDFHGRAEAAYRGLASSIDQSLKDSLVESARLAGAAIQPVFEKAMAGISREASALHGSVAQAVDRQLEGLSSRFEAAAASAAGNWESALAGHRQAGDVQAERWQAALDGFTHGFEQRSAAVLDTVSASLESVTRSVADAWAGALARHQAASQALSAEVGQALEAAAQAFGQRADDLLRSLDQSHGHLRAELASGDAQRLSAWTDALASVAASLQQEWQQAAAQAAVQQQQLVDALAQRARDMSAQADAHAKSTVAEVSRLLQAASEAPRAAAEVVAELRQKLSDSMVRDNAMLEERGRILQTLHTLLDDVNHASAQQRAAVDTLVSASAEALGRIGTGFAQKADQEAGRMAAVAAQVTGSAAEVASLGEAFGHAVQLFGQSNDKLVAQLQRIEGALGKSLSRSDEQLAYYVAQAREVIDLSTLSQQQIVEELQKLAGRPATAAA